MGALDLCHGIGMPNFLQAMRGKLWEGKGDILSHIVKVKIVKINWMAKIPEMKNVFFSHQNVPVCCHGSLKDQEQTLAEESNLFLFFPYIKKSAEKKPFGGTGKGRMFGHNTMLCRPHKKKNQPFNCHFLSTNSMWRVAMQSPPDDKVWVSKKTQRNNKRTCKRLMRGWRKCLN